jgi:carbamoylphosphate synthase large subunit
MFAYHGLRPLPALRKAIDEVKPSLLVPCDDRATMDLLSLCKRTNSTVVKEAVEHSLGSSENYEALKARSVFMRVARDAGVCVPETREASDLSALQSWLSTYGFPAYLKVDGTSGGVGVTIVRDADEAKDAFRRLSVPPAAVRVVKRLLVDRDTTFVLPFINRTRPVVNVQKTILGVETNSAVACWRGRLLACIHARVLERRDKAGHATVVRIIENQQMQETAEKVAARLGLSGIFGLDYIVEEETGRAHLIEINARATQTCHLVLGPGRSPIAALAAVMSGDAIDKIQAVTISDTIALFPQEWKRNPSSPYLLNGFHDVPWAYPELIRSSVQWRLQDQESFSYQKWLQKRGRS